MATFAAPGRPRGAHSVPLTALAAFALGLSGCSSGKYPVRGAVTLDDGTPLAKGLVVFERTDGGPPVTARGTVGPDGQFTLSTEVPGDGVPTGRYRVLVNPLDLSDVPDELKDLPFDIKYTKFGTSGLEFDIKAGPNDFPIRLEKSKKHRR